MIENHLLSISHQLDRLYEKYKNMIENHLLSISHQLDRLYEKYENMIENHLLSISHQLDRLYEKYENFILLGDFNAEVTEDAMEIFCDTHNLKNLVKEPTCFKSVNNPSCIDLILTNRASSFQNTNVLETGLSDFHKLAVTVMKIFFRKQKPKIINSRNYKNFRSEIFRKDLQIALNWYNINVLECSDFESIFIDTLNKHAPLKQRYIRANNSPFMNSAICKAIMFRSQK